MIRINYDKVTFRADAEMTDIRTTKCRRSAERCGPQHRLDG
jgi:hypothetical protein